MPKIGKRGRKRRKERGRKSEREREKESRGGKGRREGETEKRRGRRKELTRLVRFGEIFCSFYRLFFHSTKFLL